MVNLDTHIFIGFPNCSVGRMRESLNFGRENPRMAYSKLGRPFCSSVEDRMMRVIWKAKVWFLSFQRRARTLLGTD